MFLIHAIRAQIPGASRASRRGDRREARPGAHAAAMHRADAPGVAGARGRDGVACAARESAAGPIVLCPLRSAFGSAVDHLGHPMRTAGPTHYRKAP